MQNTSYIFLKIILVLLNKEASHNILLLEYKDTLLTAACKVNIVIILIKTSK